VRCAGWAARDAARWLPRAGPSYGQSPRVARRLVGSITHRTPAIRRAWPRRCLAVCIGPVDIVTNGIERHHEFLKERLRPMRGLESVASVAIFMRGQTLMRNSRHLFLPDSAFSPTAAGIRVDKDSPR
jgi:transposase-like protein